MLLLEPACKCHHDLVVGRKYTDRQTDILLTEK